ncbi:hypothetical protein ACET3Z_020581 [Daucus carota]
MSKLASLDLSYNYLYNDFPIAIFNLPGLLVLNVSGNQDLSGYLPEFNKTSPLRELDIDLTDFFGTIPSSIGDLQSLTRLRLKKCYFSGSIPASIGNMTQLTDLSVASNMLDNSDDLSWLEKLTKLTLLDLGDSNIYVSKNCGTPQSPPDDNEDGSEEDKFPSGFDWLFILVGLGSGLVVGFVMGDISMDRHPGLIRGIVQKFGLTEETENA